MTTKPSQPDHPMREAKPCLLVRTPKKTMGRPRRKIDLQQVERLAIIQCTDEEIAVVLDLSFDTLARRKKTVRNLLRHWSVAEPKDSMAARNYWKRHHAHMAWKKRLKQRDTQGIQKLDRSGNPTDGGLSRVWGNQAAIASC